MSESQSVAELETLILGVLREELLDVGDDFDSKTDLIGAGLDSLTAAKSNCPMSLLARLWSSKSMTRSATDW